MVSRSVGPVVLRLTRSRFQTVILVTGSRLKIDNVLQRSRRHAIVQFYTKVKVLFGWLGVTSRTHGWDTLRCHPSSTLLELQDHSKPLSPMCHPILMGDSNLYWLVRRMRGRHRGPFRHILCKYGCRRIVLDSECDSTDVSVCRSGLLTMLCQTDETSSRTSFHKLFGK